MHVLLAILALINTQGPRAVHVYCVYMYHPPQVEDAWRLLQQWGCLAHADSV